MVFTCDTIKAVDRGDDLSEADARRRIAAQMSQDEKKEYADDLIDTSRGFDDTRQQTEDLVRRLRKLAE